MNRRRVFRVFLVFLCVGVTVATVSNVALDNAEVRALAEQTACGPKAATCAMTRMDRTPIQQSFELVTKGETVEVVCRRSAILVGPYACVRERDMR